MLRRSIGTRAEAKMEYNFGALHMLFSVGLQDSAISGTRSTFNELLLGSRCIEPADFGHTARECDKLGYTSRA